MADFRKIDKKWQKRWEKEGLFEADIEKRKKFFTSLIIPYVNGGLHIGHTFTFARTDAYARYKRMRGYNVLLAQGFHATGEPILGTVERIRNNDKSQLETFRLYGATENDIKNFRKKGAEYVARFWTKKIIEDMKRIGFSIDWRRTFITAIQPQFSRFIEWQYNTLRRKGYVTQGTHPVVWCPHCKSPTGDHDRLEGEGESPQEVVLAKFKAAEGEEFIICGTLTPEALLGDTNIWVNPDENYVVLRINKEKWIVSKETLIKLKDQILNAHISEEGEIEGGKLIGKHFIGPLTGSDVMALPAKWIDGSWGSGIVFSSLMTPVDYIAMEELKRDEGLLLQYNLDQNEIDGVKPKNAIRIEGLGKDVGKSITEEFNITSTELTEKLEKAKNEFYKRLYHRGSVADSGGKYAGLPVTSVRDRIKNDLLNEGKAVILYDLTGTVICRCTTRNHVKILENQWFLKYSDEDWKRLAKRCLERTVLYPEGSRTNFLNTIDWLKDKACARKTGLGTPLPWDKEWIVETLSDSTIYMAYYPIARIINGKKIPAKKLTDEVFDYVFLGKGDTKRIAKDAKLSGSLLKQMREEFLYFYPVDMRNSGKDLIQNHLTFYILHHVAFWPERMWPRAIGANGYVNVEGKKMSKSKGNIQPLRGMLKQFGADLVRINIASSNEGMDDADWRVENIKGLRSRYEFLWELTKNSRKARSREMRNIDRHVLSRLQRTIETVTKSYEEMKFRTVAMHALFETTNLLKWYLTRVGDIKHANRIVIKSVLSDTIRMLAPLTPHICEEMWATNGGKKFVSSAQWPEQKAHMVDIEAEIAEELVKTVLSDVDEIRKIARIEKVKNVSLFVAEDWKFRVYTKVLRNKEKGMNEITKEIMQSEAYGKATVDFIQNLYKRINELRPILSRNRQLQILNETKGFFEKEFGCEVEIIDANRTENRKAKSATPQKPGILIE